LDFIEVAPSAAITDCKRPGTAAISRGFSGVLYLLPEKRFGVVILSNLEGQNTSFDFIGLSRKIYDIFCSQ
jgi:hypothetical protein